METRKGIFYGVGVGPGDPELLTVKALRTLERCPVIAAPQTKSGEMLALDIVRRAAALEGKTILPLFFTMARDKSQQRAAHETAADAIAAHLTAGRDVAMLNLGDVSIYATFGYIMDILRERGYEAVMIPGVPSFCAAAARLGLSLVSGETPLHIVPGAAWDQGADESREASAPGAGGVDGTGPAGAGGDGGGLRPAHGKTVFQHGGRSGGGGVFCHGHRKGAVIMVHFVGAGPGAPDLITLRGAELVKQADIIIYAGSLVNPEILALARPDCRVYNSAEMTLEQTLAVMEGASDADIVRLHTGDPCLYGAIREQMDALDKLGIPWDDTPGVSSFCGAAAALGAEFTLPGVSQSVIITRMAGRTPVPERESLEQMAQHGASMAVFLSAGLLEEVQASLLRGAYTADTPAAIVYKATWPEERIIRCTVGTLAAAGAEAGIRKTAMILVGGFLSGSYERSKLYDPAFTTEYRRGIEP